MAMCPNRSESKILLGQISHIVNEVKSWWDTTSTKCQIRTRNCLVKEQRAAVRMLLCEGDQSKENIAVLRTGVLQPICLNSKNDIVCEVLMWATEPKRVEFMILFLRNTPFCRSLKTPRVFPNTIEPSNDRKKRQYDLLTIYDIYSNIFCSSDKYFIEVIESNNPDSLEEVPLDMHLPLVMLRFRGTACCLLYFSSHDQGSC